MFNQAIKHDLVTRNEVDKTAPIEKSDFESKALTEAQVQSLVAVLPATDYGLFVLMCVTMGMRPAEVRGLRWEDLNMEKGMVDVCQQIHDARGGGYLIQPPKTKKGRRLLPLPATITAKLIEHRAIQTAKNAEASTMGMAEPYPQWANLVFRGEEGRPLAERYLRRKFKEFLKNAGLSEDFRLYDCRHTFNAILSADGVSSEVRRDLMGHATTALVDNVYSHVMPASKIGAIGTFDRLIGDCRTK